MILAGDVGGTKVHLSLYNFTGGELCGLREEKFPAAKFACLDDVVKEFLSHGSENREEIVASCFGCPGPVRDGRLKLTNLPWSLDARDLQRSLGIEHIFLINDLLANAYGIPELSKDKIFNLHEGDQSSVGHRGLVSPGTGLGEAVLVYDAQTRRHTPLPSEGGHVDFAPRNDREIALLQYLRRLHNGRVSFERVIAGIGIRNVYNFLRDEQGMEEPAWLRERMEAEDPNAVIGSSAEAGTSAICAETMNLFAAALGAFSGNLALTLLAAGGIYIGGGIAPKVLKVMQNGKFTEAFLDKGRMRPILESIPVRIVMDDSCALLGAAAYAEARAAELSGKSERAASLPA